MATNYKVQRRTVSVDGTLQKDEIVVVEQNDGVVANPRIKIDISQAAAVAQEILDKAA